MKYSRFAFMLLALSLVVAMGSPRPAMSTNGINFPQDESAGWGVRETLEL